MMKSYLEIKVPICYESDMLSGLRDLFKSVPVRWQQGFFHITMVFIDESPVVDLCPVFQRHFQNFAAPVLTFDKLDVFSTPSGMFIIYLGTSNIPETFAKLVNSIREDLLSLGCKIQFDFKLHVTLGRLLQPAIDISEIKLLANSMNFSPVTMRLSEVDYREFRGKTICKTALR